MKRLTGFLLTLVLSLGLLGGCAAPAAQPSPSASSDIGTGDWIGTADSPADSETPAAFPLTLTDQAGREVTISAPAEKIVSGYYISTSALIALGLKDRVVGIEKKIIPIYELAAPGFLELPNVGTAKEFDLEGCLALKPDLVILPKKLKDAAETITQQGIPVLLVNPEDQMQLVEMLTLIGQATSTEEAAQRLVSAYETSAQTMDAINATLAEDQKPTVYLGGNGALLTTAPRDMYQATLIRMGGGVNAGDALEGDTWTPVSYEQVLAMNPDVILLPSDAAYTVDDVLNDTQLAGVAAVKDGKVYAMPGDLESWDSPVPSCFLGSEWIMYTLHPDLFPQETFTADVAVFYQEFYGIDVGVSVLN